MRIHRVLVPPQDLPEGAGERVVVRGDEHHHLARVLRVRAGDRVSVFDGRGRGFLGVVEDVTGDGTHVLLDAPDERRVEPGTAVTLLQALPHHGDRMDLVVQKTTELGVARIVPITSDRSVPRPAADRTTGRVARWRRIAAEAAKQSGRRVVPSVESPRPLVEGIGILEGPGPRLIFTSEEHDAPSLSGETLGRTTGVALLVGPEGGWSGADRAVAAGAECVPVTLGPRVLRTETAGIVAVALALHLAGDLAGSS